MTKKGVLFTAFLAALLGASVAGYAVTISSSTFETAGSTDGWGVLLWKNGNNFGSMVQTAGVGNPGGAMKNIGNGATDSAWSNTREGCQFYSTTTPPSAMSTVGYQNIKVSFDFKFTASGNTWAGVVDAGGNPGSVYHRLLEEQLVVKYMTVVDVWIEEAWWSRNASSTFPAGTTGLATWKATLPSGWTTYTIDLSGVPAVNNNPVFNMLFQWQVNQATDIGYLDNIIVTGDLIPEPGALALLSLGLPLVLRRRRRSA